MDELINLFNSVISGETEYIQFSKGYKEFEELYELNKHYLDREERKEFGYTIVKVSRKNEKD